jgi:hypothetical protein
MARRGLTYRDLAALLTATGLEENEGNLRSKVTRGELPAATLLAVLHAMRCKTISVEDLANAPDPDPEDRPTLDSALRHDLVQVKSRDDEAGLYDITIGSLRTVIHIRLERRTSAGDTVYFLSHVIRAVDEVSPSPCVGYGNSPARCLHEAIARLTRVYEGATNGGLTPSEKWVRPC